MNNQQNSYLDSLNPEQREAVCHTGSPLLILAGAGSGKTRVITTKIAWLIAEQNTAPESILAVTFTNKAAREMAERTESLDPRAGRAVIRTFHSFGAWLLRRYGQWAGLNQNFTIYDDDDSVSLLMKTDIKLNKQEAQGVMRKISRAKDCCLTPESPLLKSIDPLPEFADLYRTYQQRLQETGNADFGDLIMLPVLLLQNNPEIAAAIHRRFRVLLVDEYQDSNHAQFQLLKALTSADTYVCVVGDDDQSIYRFRGAELQNILTFEDRFEHTKIIRLERNYRSYAPILRVADCVVAHNDGRLGKTLIAERGEGAEKPSVFYLPNQETEAELCIQLIRKAVEQGGSYSDWAILYRTNAQSRNFETAFLHGKIPHQVIGTLKFYEREEIKDAVSLLAFIANGRDEIAFRRMINKPVRGIGAVTQDKLIAYARSVLFTQNPQGTPMQDGSVQDGYAESEADSTAAAGAVVAAANTAVADDEYTANDGTAVSAANNNYTADFVSVLLDGLPRISVSKKTAKAVESFLECIQSLRRMLAEHTAGQNQIEKKDKETLAVFVAAVIETSGLAEFYRSQDEVQGTQRAANLEELLNAAGLYDCTPEGLSLFLEHIELDRSLAENTAYSDAVQLITIHNTKGLEFRNVILTGLENSIFPRDTENEDGLEEERRLMYVACTRAQDRLYMTSCSVRRLYGRLAYMQPSLFLSEIEPELVEISRAGGAAGYQSRRPPQGQNIRSLWKCGQKIYHEDYGSGVVSESYTKGTELIIIVEFESGNRMKFFPAYQQHDLFRVE